MTAATMSRPTVLVVDDSRPVRMVLRVALAQDGYEVLEAEDGQEALERLDGRRIHLVLSDFNMPRLDGLGFIAAAKKLGPYRFTPMVIFAAGPDDPTVARARELGVRAWLFKPFQAPAVLSAARRLVWR